MIPFLIFASLLVAATLALLSRPWWRSRRSSARTRSALNAAIYRDELAEIERDRASGELGEVDHAQARDELQRRLIEDMAEQDVPAAPAANGRHSLIALVVALPLAAASFYAWLGNPGALDQTPQRPMTSNDVDRMVASLAEKLEKEPDNLQGWAMLARSYKVLRRPQEAMRAFEKAGTFVEQDPQMLADYADLLASQNGGNLDGRPDELIAKALKLDPDHMQSLWLAGTGAFNRHDYAKAVEHWERAARQLPPDSEDARMMANIISEAREKGGLKKQAAASTGAAVSGHVELTPALKSQAAPSDTVFILARGEDGPMPLAVMRARVADLPMDFRLDDSNALAPGRNLSSAKSVRIEARIAKGGDAQSRAGDLAGSAGPVKPGAKNLRIRIDTVVK